MYQLEIEAGLNKDLSGSIDCDAVILVPAFLASFYPPRPQRFLRSL